MFTVTGCEVTGNGVAVDATPAMFPGLTWVDDELLMTYSTVPDGWPGGTVGVVRSTDSGRTWSQPRTVAEPLNGQDAVLNAVGVTTLSDGTVLLPYNGVRWTPGKGVSGRVVSLHLLRSADGGHTWSGGEPIELDFYGPCVYGRLVEQADGPLLWPVWGQRSPTERWRSTLLESSDAGRSWEVGATIGYDPLARLSGSYATPEVNGLSADGNPELTDVTGPDFRPHSPIDGFTETTVTEVGSSRLLAVMRQQGVDGDDTLQLFRSESADGGGTWSAPEPIGIAGTSPLLHRAHDGTVFLAGRRSTRADGSSGAGVEFRVSNDGGVTWSLPTPLRDPYGRQPAAEYQCGYPAMADLPEGSVLVVFYSYAQGKGRYVAWNTIGARRGEWE